MAVVVPLLAEAVEMAAAGVAEEEILASVGEKLQSVFGQAVSTAAANYAYQHSQEIVDGLFGQGTYDQFIKNLNHDVNEAADFLKDLEFGLPFGTSESKRIQENLELQKNIERQKRYAANQIYQNEINKHLAELYLKEHENPIKSSIPLYGPNTDLQKIPLVPNTDTVPSPSTTPMPLSIDNVSGETGAKAAEFIIKFINHSLDKQEGSSMSDFFFKNPNLMDVGKHYIEYMKTIRPKELSNEDIKRIYNGHSLDVKKVFKFNNKFAAYDETGKLEYYDGKAAPVSLKNDAALAALGFIKPIHGYWMGPLSYNNNFPVDYVDLCSMFHDIEYLRNGWFFREGDLKYISRLSQNMDKMSFTEQLFAKFAIKYFSTIGAALATVSGSLNDPKNSTEDNVDDFFTYLHNKSNGIISTGDISSGGMGGNSQISSYLEYNVDKMNRKIINRQDFYKEFEKKSAELYKQSAPSLPTSTNSFTNNPILQFLLNLPVLEYTN